MPPLEFLRRLASPSPWPANWSQGGGPQARVVRCGGGRRPALLRIDLAIEVDGALLVAGWRTGGLRVSLDAASPRSAASSGDVPARRASVTCTDTGEAADLAGLLDDDGGDGEACAPAPDAGAPAGAHAAARRFDVPRPDVAEHVGVPDRSLGFALLIDPMPPGPLVLTWRHPVDGGSGRHRLRVQRATWQGEGPSLRLRGLPRLAPAGGESLAALAARWPTFSPPWRAFVSRCPNVSAEGAPVAGHLESACVGEPEGGAVVTGWLAARPGVPVWLQDEDGNVHRVEGATPRHFRDDAFRRAAQLGIESAAECGFAMALPDVTRPVRLRMRALAPQGVIGLGSTPCERLPAQPLEAARRLVQMDPTSPLDPARLAVIDAALIAPIVRRHAATFDPLPVETEVAGRLPGRPIASVVVPLYARRDLVEHQLLAFADDPAFRDRIELIYVIDDPRLLPHWRADAQHLAQSWGVPMRWVWGGTQRGFAGASNLGARFARANRLVFLNSDVFPLAPGWVERLCAALDADAGIGAVGPRLLHADGSLQHAGMSFRWRGDLGLWINHHPAKGLAPAHDPHAHATAVDAVTGACLAMRRDVFEQVGGWDTGYLVGDFEDSDLCLRLRERGLRSTYLPEVSLTHLERQSMRDVGEARLRRYVTLVNAVRHQARWSSRLEAIRAQATAIACRDDAPAPALDRAA